MGEGRYEIKKLFSCLPEGWEAKAKELGAFQRAREVKTPEDLLRLILLYLTEGKSFAGTSAILRLGGEYTLNKVAVWKRVRNSRDWLKWLCENLYRQNGLLVEKPAWLGKKNVCLVDGSEDVICGNKKNYFRLHYCLDLFTLGVRELGVTKITEGEKVSRFQGIGKGDVVIGDRAYGNRPGIQYIREQGADYLLRLGARGFTVYNRKGGKIDIPKRFKGLKPGESKDFQGYCVIEDEHVPVRICAVRKDRDSERAGLKRLRKTYQRKNHGKPVSERQSEYNKYVIAATSLGEETTASQVMELYRGRWQIELAFKRLKSLFHYNEIPAKLDESAYAWFYGKLLLAALCETAVNTGRFSPRKEQGRT